MVLTPAASHPIAFPSQPSVPVPSPQHRSDKQHAWLVLCRLQFVELAALRLRDKELKPSIRHPTKPAAAGLHMRSTRPYLIMPGPIITPGCALAVSIREHGCSNMSRVHGTAPSFSSRCCDDVTVGSKLRNRFDSAQSSHKRAPPSQFDEQLLMVRERDEMSGSCAGNRFRARLAAVLLDALTPPVRNARLFPPHQQAMVMLTISARRTKAVPRIKPRRMARAPGRSAAAKPRARSPKALRAAVKCSMTVARSGS